MSDIVCCKDCVYSAQSNLAGDFAELSNLVYCTYYKHNISIIRGCGNGKPKPQTNADRIRAMTDEELADWLIMNGDGSDYETWLAWLKQEAET